jgi:hypothetical protein
MPNLAMVWKREWEACWAANVLPFQPQYTVTEKIIRQSSVFVSDGLDRQSFPLMSEARRIWEGLRFTNLTAEQKDELIAFFKGLVSRDQVSGFIWPQPDGSEIKCLLKEYKASREQNAPDRYGISVSFVELLG